MTLNEIGILLPLILFSVLAFWKESAVMFILTAAIALMTGLKWFDIYVTDFGLSISLILIVYTFVCFGFALKIIWTRRHGDEEE